MLISIYLDSILFLASRWSSIRFLTICVVSSMPAQLPNSLRWSRTQEGCGSPSLEMRAACRPWAEWDLLWHRFTAGHGFISPEMALLAPKKATLGPEASQYCPISSASHTSIPHTPDSANPLLGIAPKLWGLCYLRQEQFEAGKFISGNSCVKNMLPGGFWLYSLSHWKAN